MDSMNTRYQFLTPELPFFSKPRLEIQSLPGDKLAVFMPLEYGRISTLCDLLDGSASLSELYIEPPTNTLKFFRKREEIFENLSWFISKSSETQLQDLECVSLPLDLGNLEPFLGSIQELPLVRHLEIVAPTTFAYTTQTDDFRRRVMIGIERKLEGLTTLDEIIIPAFLGTGTFATLLNRMFESTLLLPGARFYYFHRARNMLDETPSMFLPGA